MAKKNNIQDENLENVQEALNTSGKWIEEHQKLISWVLCGIFAVVLAVMAIRTYVINPRMEAAEEEIAKAVVYYQAGAYEVALNGDEADCLGFAAIADDYSNKAGKLAALYAGICEYQLGNYEDALVYLKKFDADDAYITPAAHLLLADTYVELGEYDAAVKAYAKVIKTGNELLAPVALKKQGIVYLKLEENEKAAAAFKAVKEDYPQSLEASDIEKYIAQ